MLVAAFELVNCGEYCCCSSDPAVNDTERYSQTRGITFWRWSPFIPFAGHFYHQPHLLVYHTVPNCQSIPALPCSLANGRAIRIRCSTHSPIQVTGEQIKFQGGGGRKLGISTLPYAALRYLPVLSVYHSVPHQWHCLWTCCE